MVALQWGRDRSVAEITARVGRLRTYWIGFNGAATDRSRKLPPSARAGSGSQSFNGAATDRSRKCNGHRAVPHRSRPASMGPRPIGRGNTHDRHPSLSPWNASMGPRPIGRGNAGYGEHEPAAKAASMGPRPIGRGNDLEINDDIFIHEASMGPRPIGRGNQSHTYMQIT